MTRRALAIVTLLLVATAIGGPARAADHVVGGTQLTLRRNGTNGALALVLRDPAVPIPAPGGPDDPSAAGLVVTLFGRGSLETASLFAPAGLGQPGWKVRTAPQVTHTFANPTVPPGGAQLRSVVLRQGSGLKLRAKSAGLTLAAPEGAVAVRIEFGSTRVCALFDGAAVRRDGDGRFVARDADAPGLADCADATLSGACGGLASPECSGTCPAGQECASIGGLPYPSCGCLPAGSTPCGGVYPSCGDGDCPTGTSCFADTFHCCGDVVIDGCSCLAEPPPEPCPGGCPTGWSCVAPIPLQPAFCLPPFCSGGTGAPVCDGACSLAGTECTSISGLCLCMAPCGGGDPYPTCGGTCADAGFACRGVEGHCVCLPS